MKPYSFLLALSGSEQSRFAAEAAWHLAEKLNASVTAEHVIDSRTVWELLRNDTPGFIGSGPYIAAYEQTVASLNSLANKLTLEYEAHASGRKIEGECVIRDGNPVTILSKDARNYDLLIVGHQPSGVHTIDRDRSHYIRYSIAEGLAQESSIPVLITQARPFPWTKAIILSEMDHLNFRYLRGSFDFAKKLGIKPQLEFWGTGSREETPGEFEKNLFQELPEAKSMNIDFEILHGSAVSERRELYHALPVQSSVEAALDSLLIMPTRGLGRERLTVLGLAPETFIRTLTLPNLLLWPEEKPEFGMRREVAAATAKAPN